MKYHNESPIYQQIMKDIKEKIIMGEYGANMQIPPVREIAIQYEVNPNTMQRSLSELEREGYVYSQRTAGRFVIDDVERIKQMKEELIQQKIDKFLQEMSAFTMKEDELKQQINERMKEYGKHSKSNETV